MNGHNNCSLRKLNSRTEACTVVRGLLKIIIQFRVLKLSIARRYWTEVLHAPIECTWKRRWGHEISIRVCGDSRDGSLSLTCTVDEWHVRYLTAGSRAFGLYWSIRKDSVRMLIVRTTRTCHIYTPCDLREDIISFESRARRTLLRRWRLRATTSCHFITATA